MPRLYEEGVMKTGEVKRKKQSLRKKSKEEGGS
jgi:hypothetical protein